MSRASSGKGKKGVEDKEQPGYKVVMPPDKFIPVSVSDITDTLRSNVRHEDRHTFTEICQLVEGCATTEFASLRRRVKKNYRFFSHAAMRRDMPTRKGRGIKKEDTMDEMEMTFLNDFWELMDTAHYKCMSQADWVAVQQERLMLDMPLDVHWASMDSRMLSRFFERHPARSEGLYQHHDRALLFHRGVGVVRRKELWIMQKVDLVVNYLVARPTRLAFYKLAPHLWKRARDRAHVMQEKDRVREADPNELAHAAERDASEPLHPNAQIINRVSLRTLLPDTRSVFRNLFTQLEVVEPTYKDIIMLYRKTVPAPSEKDVAKDRRLGERFRRDRRGIFVKRFDEVPIADVEVVFPENEIGLKAIDKLTLVATVIAALITAVVSVVQGSLSMSLAMSVLSTVGGKLYQTYATAQRKKADLQKQIANKVFDISMDAQEGACYSVLDEMADQYIKEQLLAYFTLLRHRYPASEEELDEACESWLTDRFDVKIDFAIEESLPRLLQDGLVVHAVDDDDPRLAAVELETAHARLLEKWQTAFTYDESSEGSLRSSITQPFSGVTRAASNAGKAFGKAARIIPGAQKLPGLKRHSSSDTAVTDAVSEGGTKLRKREKFKRLFKHKKKHDDDGAATATIPEHSQDLGEH